MSTAPRSLNHVDLTNPFAKSGRSKQLRSKGQSHRDKPSPWIWVLALCCVVAIGISGYLTWTSLTSSKIAGCGSGSVFDCSHVTNSKWSLWMGLPVSALAIASYVSLGTALAFAVFSTSAWVKRLSWTAVATFSISAGLAALWFIGLQHFVLEHYCSYCLVAHSCGIIATLIAVWIIPDRMDVLKFAAPFAATGFAILIVGQVYQAEPEKFRIETFEPVPALIETFEAPGDSVFEAPVFEAPIFEAPVNNAGGAIFEAPVATNAAVQKSGAVAVVARLFSTDNVLTIVRPATALLAFTSPLPPLQNGQAASDSNTKAKTQDRRTVGINGGTIQLDVKQWPLNGAVDAKHIFVEMLDYNCPNCRKTHKAVTGAKKLLNDDVSVMILPIPLNTACNSAVTKTDSKFVESCDIAKLAIAVWRVDAEKFCEFHEAMFSGENAPTLAEATAMAKSMVDPVKLDAEIASGIPAKYISSMVQLYVRSGKGGVPKLMFPGTSIVGEFTSAESLVDVIKQQTK